MALQTLSRPLAWPLLLLGGTGSVGFGTTTVNAAGEYVAFILEASENMTVSHVAWRAGTATGSPTVDVRIETVDAAGLPSGTLWGANTNIVTGAVTSNTVRIDALTASASISKGQIFAVKIQYTSGTSLIISRTINTAVPSGMQFPYIVQNTGTPAKSGGGYHNIALGSGATAFYNVFGAMQLSVSTTTLAFNNTSAERAAGVRFRVPFSCSVVGMRHLDQGSPAGDFNVVLYDDSGAQLGSSSKTYDGDYTVGGAQLKDYRFTNSVTLSPNTWYRAAFEPSTATNTALTYATLSSADLATATPGGANFYYCQRDSGGAWTDTTTRIPWLDILIDQLDDGAGGGSPGGARIIGGTVVR